MHLPRRRSPRAQRYDYTADGTYFITICCKQMHHYFGKIENGIMQFNKCGRICETEIQHMVELRKTVILDEYIIMPNHIHMLLHIAGTGISLSEHNNTTDNASIVPAKDTLQYKTQSLASIIGSFKSAVSRECHKQWILFAWQGRYHDYIVRNEDQYRRIKKYIVDNPINRLV